MLQMDSRFRTSGGDPMDVRRIRNSRGWIEGTGFAKPSHEPNANYRPMLMNLSLVKRNELKEESFFLLHPSIFSLYRTRNNSFSESSDFSISFFFFFRKREKLLAKLSQANFSRYIREKNYYRSCFSPCKYNFICC